MGRTGIRPAHELDEGEEEREMRRIISALALASVVALAGVAFTDSDQPQAAAAPPVLAEAVRTDDFLLLHDGDSVRVLFRRDAGPGSIRFLSLSENSRLDILHPVAVAEKYSFRREDGRSEEHTSELQSPCT